MVSFIKLFGFPIHKLVEKHDDIHNRFIIRNVIFPRDFPTINRMKIIGFFFSTFHQRNHGIFSNEQHLCAYKAFISKKKLLWKKNKTHFLKNNYSTGRRMCFFPQTAYSARNINPAGRNVLKKSWKLKKPFVRHDNSISISPCWTWLIFALLHFFFFLSCVCVLFCSLLSRMEGVIFIVPSWRCDSWSFDYKHFTFLS